MSRNIVALYLFSFFMIMPVVGLFPALPLIRDDLSLTYSQVSIFVASLGIVRICLALPSGFLVDRFEQKKILLLSGTLSFMGLVVLGSSRSLYELLFSRVLIGAGSILSSITLIVLLAHLAPPEKKGTMMSLNNVVHSLGHIVSSASVGAMAQFYHWRIPFFVLAGFILGSSLMIFITFSVGDGPDRQELRDQGPREGKQDRKGINIPRRTALAPVFMVSFFAFFYRGSFRHTLIPFYGKDVFHLNAMDLGFYISLTGVLAMGSFIAFGIISDRWGRKRVTMLGLTFTFLSILALFLPRDLHPFLVSCSLVGLGASINSMPNVLISDLTSRGNFGKVMGVNRVFSNSAYFVGAALSGIMLDRLGFRFPLYLLVALCLLVILSTALTLRKVR